MDSRAQDGPENGGWTRERRIGSRAQDGPENEGWTRERRMGSRAQDGPESGGWTRERSMDPRARTGFERRGWTSIKTWPSLFLGTKKEPIRKKGPIRFRHRIVPTFPKPEFWAIWLRPHPFASGKHNRSKKRSKTKKKQATPPDRRIDASA